MKRDSLYWFGAVFLGLIACILLYTCLGYLLVRTHATFISAEMQIFTHFHMIPVVLPGDVYITSKLHLLGSSLFFGLTLGTFIAIIASILSIPIWIRKRVGVKFGMLTYVLLATIACILGYSKEMPVPSLFTGMLAPGFFFLPWWAIARHAVPQERQVTTWPVFFIIILLPGLVLLPGLNYTRVRDMMVSTPILRSLSRFYYDHTLLAAHVIKPIKYRTQNVIAIPPDTRVVAFSPPGTLWVRTAKPCSMNGIAFAVNQTRLNCPHVLVKDTTELNRDNKLVDKASIALDFNRSIRRTIGTFLHGPELLVPLFLLGWISAILSRLYTTRGFAAIVLILAYYALFMPSLRGIYITRKVMRDPGLVHEYAISESREKRYACLVTHPERLNPAELKRLARDDNPGTRLNALIEMGRRHSSRFIPDLIRGARDPQLNVRTKACEALGVIGGKRALRELEEVLNTETNWYVRDYAYNAACRIRPIAAVVNAP